MFNLHDYIALLTTVLQLEHTNIKSHLFVSYTCLFVFSCQADESSDSSEDERGDNNAEKKSHYGKKTTVQCEQWLAFIIPTQLHAPI